MCHSSTSNSSSSRMEPYRVFLRGALILSPLIALAVFFELALWRSKEIWPLSRVSREIQAAPDGTLFMRKVFDQGLYRFKYLSLKDRRPAVIALGTSRVMQFRNEMLGAGRNDFFNAGGMIQHLRDLEEFVDTLPRDTSIRTILLGVELWWFNEKWAAEAEPQKNYLTKIGEDDALDGFAHGAVFQKLLWASLRGQCSDAGMGLLYSAAWPADGESLQRRWGLLALSKDMGFRKDGSYEYGSVAPSAEFVDREKPPIEERIRGQMMGYEPVTGLASNEVDRLLGCVKKLSDRGIRVIVFLPPFASGAAAALDESPATRSIWRQYRSELPERIRASGVQIIDASTPAKLGLDDRCMYDGLHGMETLYLTLLKQIAEDPSARAALGVDPQRIARILVDKKTNPWYPRYQ